MILTGNIFVQRTSKVVTQALYGVLMHTRMESRPPINASDESTIFGKVCIWLNTSHTFNRSGTLATARDDHSVRPS